MEKGLLILFGAVFAASLLLSEAEAASSCGPPHHRGNAASAADFVGSVFRGKWNREISEAAARSVTNQKLWNTREMGTDPKSWDNSNPPKKYRFLVRSVFPHVGGWQNKVRPDLVDMLNQTGRRKEGRVGSAALIDELQGHVTLGHPVGVILETDGSHVFSTLEFDRNVSALRSEWGFLSKDKKAEREDEFAVSLMETFGVHPPEKVLTHISRTARMPWNEITVYDGPELASPLKVSGLVVFIFDALPSYYKELQEIAKERGIPIVVIKK